MAKVTSFPAFKVSYKKLKENMRNRFLIEYHHHDMPGEPSVSVLDNATEVVYDEFDGEQFITIRLFGDTTDISFRSSAYNTNLSNDDVVFGSKHDDETYCLISFHKEVI